MNIVNKIWNFFRNKVEQNLLTVPYRLLPIEKVILFESVPDLSDNSKAVFDEMVRLGVNKEYQLIWLIRGDINRVSISIDNVKFVSAKGETFRERMRVARLEYTSACLISCNYFLSTRRKGQVSFYLTHGSPIKSVKKYYTFPNNIDYCMVASENMVDVMSYEMNADKSKLVALGYPRNDAFYGPDVDLNTMLKRQYAKVIVWYPTYRQHAAGGSKLTQNALPIIHDQEKANALNEFACQNNVMIVVKPHFAQNLSYITDLGLSNIVFIDDSFFGNNEISSYQFVKSCDALITDYSSIYYDYTLCDKPIGLIWEDYDEYKNNVGFAVDMNEYMKGAEKIYSLEDFKRFISDLASERDRKKFDRNEIKSIVNFLDDGKNSERVTRFVLDKLGQECDGHDYSKA